VPQVLRGWCHLSEIGNIRLKVVMDDWALVLVMLAVGAIEMKALFEE
jgi:hypothetical protein